MKSKKIISTLFVSLFFVTVFALEPFHIDINAEFGAMKGEINEYVIHSVAGKDYIESRLDWDVNFIRFFGASVDVVLFEHFYFTAAGRFGLPSASGNMQDYDWLNMEVKGHDKDWYDNHYWLTNYSKHDNQLTKYLDGTVRLGGIINLPYQIFLLPSISFQVQEIEFDGINGFYQYVYQNDDEYEEYLKYNEYLNSEFPEWNSDIQKKNMSNKKSFPKDGKVISYNQQRMFLFIGLKAYTTIVPRFRFEIEGNFSPFTMVGAVDNHWMKLTDYLDQPKGFGTWNISGKIQFSFDKWCRLALTCDYQCVPFITGKNYSKSTNSKKWALENGYLGGASSNLFSFSLMATLYF